MNVAHLIMFGLAMVTVWQGLNFLYRKALQWYIIGPIRPYTYQVGQLSVQYITQPNRIKVLLDGKMSDRFDTEDKLAICNAIQSALQNNFKRKHYDVEIH